MHASSQTAITNKNVSRETSSRLDSYAALLLKWNARINIIGPATEAQLCQRHLDDSAQLVPLIPESAKTLADLGSGAGLPGLVIAIHRPDLTVTLVERDQRKSAFLTEAKNKLGLLNVVVEARDVKALKATYDVVTARALAPLSELLALAAPLMGQGGIGIFPKGVGAEKEIEHARQVWGFEATRKPSATQEGASIVTVAKLNRKDG